MQNKMDNLRNHLFETLEALKDREKPMEIERARAIAQVAGVLVETAKVEVQFLEATGGTKGSGFITQDPPNPLRKIEGGRT
jgi:hypothetical protein